MTTESIHQPAVHATFEAERCYRVPVARVFAAFRDPELRMQWNSPSDEVTVRSVSADFTVGGRNIEVCLVEDQEVARVETRYLDIVENQRLLFSESISDPSGFLGASLVTVEFVEV
ncbi:MAG: SRPBCC domain-containing protein, partial [Pseudomonadota bacterium]|nr:SRPBCC domain-containing protein [Pseudomonadota bacterium]